MVRRMRRRGERPSIRNELEEEDKEKKKMERKKRGKTGCRQEEVEVERTIVEEDGL